jgi:monofunctional chorismate mutase
MSRLDKDREMIDELDAQIAELFEKRFVLVKDIIDYKIERRLPILNSEREKTIIETNVGKIQDVDIRPYFKKFYMTMLELSREYQQEILDEK